METFIKDHPLWFTIILLLTLWDLTWRWIAMWHAARMDKKSWFIAFTVLSTAGILPLLFLRNNRNK